MNPLDSLILGIANNWYFTCEVSDETDFSKFEYNKNKFRDKYFKKTGEFLRITKRLEGYCFSKISYGLSLNYTFTEELLDQYIDWCFENYDFFAKKYKGFSLNAIVQFAPEWHKDFLKFKEDDKITMADLADVCVSDNVFYNFEKYGIPLAATKLCLEKEVQPKAMEPMIVAKLKDFLKTQDGLQRTGNMLRKTVENGPYSTQICFANYRNTLSELFQYFSNEPWYNN